MEQLQLQPQRHKQRGKSLFSGFIDAIESAAEAIVDACDYVKEKVGELFKPDEPLIQQTPVIQSPKVSVGVSAGSAVQTDEARELIIPALRLLGEVESSENVDFFKALHVQTGYEFKDITPCLKCLLDTGSKFSDLIAYREETGRKIVLIKTLRTQTGYEFTDIASCLKCLLDIGLSISNLMEVNAKAKEKIVFIKTLHAQTEMCFSDIVSGLKRLLGAGLSFSEIMELKVDNVVALLIIWHLRKDFKTSSSTDMVYKTLQVAVGTRVDGWMEKMMAAISRAVAPSGEGNIEEVLRDYVRCAAEEIVVPYEWAFRLFRIAILMAGFDMPSIDTIKMTALWGLMLSDMCKAAPEQESILEVGVALLAMWISLSLHMETDSIASSYGDVLKALSNKTPEIIKNKFYTMLQRSGDTSMDAKKYLAWNKTVGVLIEHESLDMSGAMRMMSTFTIGRTFAKSLTDRFDLWTFLRDLSPIPGRRAIHDLLTLFRQPSEYKRRTEIVYSHLDGLAQGKHSQEMEEKAAGCYCDLAKLKLAFTPYYNYSDCSGFIDPNNTPIDDTIIDIISVYAFSRNNNGLINRLRRRQFKSQLRKRLVNSPDIRYLSYFGEPRRPKRKESAQITYE